MRLQEILKPEVMAKVVYNIMADPDYDEIGPAGELLDFLAHMPLADQLARAFLWEYTPEGAPYWAQVHGVLEAADRLIAFTDSVNMLS